MTIPIFTVTVNPLEADEMTYVPGNSNYNHNIIRILKCYLSESEPLNVSRAYSKPQPKQKLGELINHSIKASIMI